jgi:hypothetical protein
LIILPSIKFAYTLNEERTKGERRKTIVSIWEKHRLDEGKREEMGLKLGIRKEE